METPYFLTSKYKDFPVYPTIFHSSNGEKELIMQYKCFDKYIEFRQKVDFTMYLRFSEKQLLEILWEKGLDNLSSRIHLNWFIPQHKLTRIPFPNLYSIPDYPYNNTNLRGRALYNVWYEEGKEIHSYHGVQIEMGSVDFYSTEQVFGSHFLDGLKEIILYNAEYPLEYYVNASQTRITGSLKRLKPIQILFTEPIYQL